MDIDNNLVNDYMRLSEIFINEDDSAFNALEMLSKFSLKKILVIKKDFSVLGCLNKSDIKKALHKDFKNIQALKNTKIKDLNIRYDSPVFIYPKMGINDAYSIMKYFNVKYLPVVDVPWDKKIIGFLWIEDILSVIKKNCFKVPATTSL